MLHLQGISQLGPELTCSHIKFPGGSETSLRGCIDLQCINTNMPEFSLINVAEMEPLAKVDRLL